MVLGEGVQRLGVLGEEPADELPEAPVELGARAAGLGHDEAPLVDVVAEGPLGLGGELGGLVPVEVEDRGLQEVLDGGGGGVDDLPGQQVLPVPGDGADEVADVVGVEVPVVAGPVAELVDQHGRPALGQEEQREAGADQGLILEEPDPGPVAEELVLLVDELLGPLAIPVVVAEEALARQPAGALQAVEVVILPALAVAEVLPDEEVARHPVDGALEARC